MDRAEGRESDLATDIQHVLPALAIDRDSNDVHITYYMQHSNRSIDLDMANSHDGGNSFPPERTVRVTSTSFDLPPTNVPLTNSPSFSATITTATSPSATRSASIRV